MHEAAGWQFDLEIHPPEWRFPAGRSWIAGWIRPLGDQMLSDLRAWVDERPFLGLHGLPRPEIEQRFLSRPGPPYLGFSLLIDPPRGARFLRLEVRAEGGPWQFLFQTAITAAADAEPAPLRPSLANLAGENIPALLRLHAHRPAAPFAELAEELVSAALAVPLNTLPNPPFCGALEEPRAEGWIRYGRLAMTGWLGHREVRIRRLTAMVDPRQEFTLAHGLPRRDIGQLFPDLPNHDNLAFVDNIDLALTPGLPVLLKIFAELENGQKHLVFAQRFVPRVILGAEPPLPVLSLRTFTGAAWAYYRAARRLGLAPGSWRARLAALTTAWKSYAAEAPSTLRSIPAQSPGAVASLPSGRPLKVIVVTHNLNLEGAPWFSLEYARHLAAQPGWRVEVLSPVDGPLRQKFTEAGLPVTIVEVGTLLATRTVPEFQQALPAVASGLDWSGVDLVVANTMVSFWAVHLARLAHKPAVLYIHESAPVRRFFAPLLAPALFPLVEEAFQRAARVVFIAAASQAVYARLERRHNFRFLPSWIDVAGIRQFAAANTRAALRDRHGYSREAVIFANIGSVCERKGQHIFLRAIAQLQGRPAAAGGPAPELLFLLVGARPDLYLDSLRRDIERLGLRGITIVHEVPGPYDYYGLADIFVCSSFEEAFPRVLLEAAAFGLPIVSTNVNGITEMLTPEDAWLVPPGDPAALAQAMEAALAAHLAGDHRRATRAQAGVAARYDGENSLPRHRALASEAAESG